MPHGKKFVSFSLRPEKEKLADVFYDTFIRFRLSVDVAGFVSSSVAVDDGSAAGFGISVLGSGFCFGFLSVA